MGELHRDVLNFKQVTDFVANFQHLVLVTSDKQGEIPNPRIALPSERTKSLDIAAVTYILYDEHVLLLSQPVHSKSGKDCVVSVIASERLELRDACFAMSYFSPEACYSLEDVKYWFQELTDDQQENFVRAMFAVTMFRGIWQELKIKLDSNLLSGKDLQVFLQPEYVEGNSKVYFHIFLHVSVDTAIAIERDDHAPISDEVLSTQWIPADELREHLFASDDIGGRGHEKTQYQAGILDDFIHNRYPQPVSAVLFKLKRINKWLNSLADAEAET